jgi:hypothetical protein
MRTTITYARDDQIINSMIYEGNTTTVSINTTTTFTLTRLDHSKNVLDQRQLLVTVIPSIPNSTSEPLYPNGADSHNSEYDRVAMGCVQRQRCNFLRTSQRLRRQFPNINAEQFVSALEKAYREISVREMLNNLNFATQEQQEVLNVTQECVQNHYSYNEERAKPILFALALVFVGYEQRLVESALQNFYSLNGDGIGAVMSCIQPYLYRVQH